MSSKIMMIMMIMMIMVTMTTPTTTETAVRKETTAMDNGVARRFYVCDWRATTRSPTAPHVLEGSTLDDPTHWTKLKASKGSDDGAALVDGQGVYALVDDDDMGDNIGGAAGC